MTTQPAPPAPCSSRPPPSRCFRAAPATPDQDTPGGIVIYDAGPAGAPDGAIRPNKPVMTGEIAPVYGFK